MRKSSSVSLIILIVVILIGSLGTVAKYTNRNDYIVVITDKATKRFDDSDKYLIFTKLEDGKTRVFENTDAYLVGKFNSADYFAELEVGSEYKIKTIGYRFPILSMYENIIKFEKIK